MSGRHTGSPNIPIPIPSASSSSRSRERTLEAIIPMPFSPTSPSTSRPRLSGRGLPSRTIVSGTDIGSLASVSSNSSIMMPDRRGSTSFVGTGPGMSPTRPTARSFTSSIGSRASPRSQPTFEPRVIRADTSTRSIDYLPSSTCARRTSTAGLGGRAPSISRSGASPSSSQSPSRAQGQTPFPCPAYLNHSALRHLLQTEALPTLPPGRSSIATSSGALYSYLVGGGNRRSTITPSDDSDEDNNTSPPPRDTGKENESVLEGDVNVEMLKLPTQWSEIVRHPSLSVSADGRELNFNGPSSVGEKDAAAARTEHPIPPACGIFYYEVEIVSKGQKGHISIGFAADDVKLARLPGWEKNSWGYHGDDGFSFAAEKNGNPYGPKFGTGDIVGCGIDFSQNRAFYTKNGTFLGNVFHNVGTTVPIYPSVGLRHGGEAIRVNFGHEPFKYNIEDHVLQARNMTWSGIMSTPLRSEFIGDGSTNQGLGTDGKGEGYREKAPINQLVLSYLSHHGYAKTARAFQAQCKQRGGLRSSDSGVAPLPVPAPTSHARSDDVEMEMEMDLSSSSNTSSDPLHTPVFDATAASRSSSFDGWGPGMHHSDIELRTRIVNSVICGDIDKALEETQRWHPKVLEKDDGLMRFKLRCRKFVELILEAAELKKNMKSEDASGVDGMDVDDEAGDGIATNRYSTNVIAIPAKSKRKQSISSSHNHAQYESALSLAITYGQTLQSDYKTDSRPEVRAIFKRTFGVVAYEDPLEAGGDAAEVAGHEARVALATELNQHILQSQGRPTRPALESLYRQAAVCILRLGLLGAGAAAFADMPKEFLDA